MLPTQQQIQTQAHSTLSEMLVWARTEFKLPKLSTDLQFADTKTAPFGQASETRKRTFRIKVSTYDLTRHELIGFKEYASFNHHPVIGGFQTNDWKLFVDVVVAHELAHIVQFHINRFGFQHPDADHNARHLTIKGLGEVETNHGSFFRAVYRKFREKFINHRIEPGKFGAVRKNFIVPDDFEDRMKAKGDISIKGLKVHIGNRLYTIAGRNPNNTRLFGFQVQDAAGKFYRVKLSQLANASIEVRQAIFNDPQLFTELQENERAIHAKQVANARSSMTKRFRAASRARSA
jgi:hypothetical protein